MRQPKVRSMLDHPSGQTNVTSLQSVRQSQDILLHLIAVVDDRIDDRRMLTNLLTVSSFEVSRRTGSVSGLIHLSGWATSEIRKSRPVQFRFIPTTELNHHTPPFNESGPMRAVFIGYCSLCGKHETVDDTDARVECDLTLICIWQQPPNPALHPLPLRPAPNAAFPDSEMQQIAPARATLDQIPDRPWSFESLAPQVNP